MSVGLKYLIIFVLMILGELAYFGIAGRFNIIDKPNMRSSHTKVVLRGGGVVFLLGAWLWAAFFGLQYPLFMAGLTLIAGISFADDVKPLLASLRLVVHFVAVSLMLLELGLLCRELWPVFIAASIVCVGIINVYNFMDGINGITGAYSLAVLLPLVYLDTFLPGDAFISRDLLVVVALSVLIFSFFNFRRHPKCFAGDVGAVSIAFILVFAVGSLIKRTGDYSFVMLLSVYGTDAVLTIIHRIILRENLGQAHRKHAYQIMANELGIPHLAVSALYFALQMLVSAGLVFLPVNHYLYSAVVLAVLCGMYVLFMKKYYHLHAEYLKSLDGSNRQNESL